MPNQQKISFMSYNLPVVEKFPNRVFNIFVRLNHLDWFIYNYYFVSLCVFARGLSSGNVPITIFKAMCRILGCMVYCRLNSGINIQASNTANELFTTVGIPPFLETIVNLLPVRGIVEFSGIVVRIFMLPSDASQALVIINTSLLNDLLFCKRFFVENGFIFGMFDCINSTSKVVIYNVIHSDFDGKVLGPDGVTDKSTFDFSIFTGFCNSYTWVFSLLYLPFFETSVERLDYIGLKGLNYGYSTIGSLDVTNMLNLSLIWYFQGNVLMSQPAKPVVNSAPAGKPKNNSENSGNDQSKKFNSNPQRAAAPQQRNVEKPQVSNVPVTDSPKQNPTLGFNLQKTVKSALVQFVPRIRQMFNGPRPKYSLAFAI